MQRVIKPGEQTYAMDIHEIPFVPDQVDHADLISENMMLLSGSEISNAISSFKEIEKKYFTDVSLPLPESNHLSKKVLGTKFNIIRVGEDYYAVYKGAKQARLIGKGEFGKVKVTQKLTGDDAGTWCALKVLNCENSSAKDDGDVEFSNLVRVEKGISGFTRKAKKETYQLLMKFARGINLESFNLSNRKITPTARLRAAIDILLAFDKLHRMNLIHADIKNVNIHFDKATGQIAPVDYALALKIINDAASVQRYRGSILFTAPEIFRDLGAIAAGANREIRYSISTDNYSLGITLAHWFGYLVERKRDMNDLKSGQITLTPRVIRDDSGVVIKNYTEEYLPDEKTRDAVQNVIKRMIDVDVLKRPDLRQAVIELCDLANNYLYLPARISKTALVSVEDINSDNTSLLALLSRFDQVVLLDSTEIKRRPLEYLVLRRDLERRGMNVSDHVFRHKDVLQLAREVPRYLNNQNSITMHSCFYATTGQTVIDEENICSIHADKDDADAKIEAQLRKCKVDNDDFVKIEKALKDELSRLDIKYPDTKDAVVLARKLDIRTVLTHLQDNHAGAKLTYQMLIDEINKLHEKMGHTSYISYLPTLIQPVTEGSKKITQIAADVENVFASMRKR